MTNPQSPFEKGLKLMGAQQQLAARSLVNLIEMISTSSHRYTQETTDFTRDAVTLMQKATQSRDPNVISELQNQWAKTCLKYGENQTRATMQFVEQCGLQALNIATSPTPDDTQSSSESPPSPAKDK